MDDKFLEYLFVTGQLDDDLKDEDEEKEEDQDKDEEDSKKKEKRIR